MKLKKNVGETHISCMGSCVCRDVFSLSQNASGYKENENEYTVDRFIQSINPISAIAGKLPSDLAEKLIEESQSSATSNFYKRNFKLDVEKSWENYLKEVKSDWLIVDFSTVRLPVRCVGSSYVTNSLENEVRKRQEPIHEASMLNRIAKERIMDLSELSWQKLEKTVDDYIKRLLKIYPENKIIVLDVKHVFSYVDFKKLYVSSPNHWTDFNNEKENRLIDFAYKRAKKLMSRAHFVDSLPVMIGNINHVWGKCGLHYADDVYLYFYRAIDSIINSSRPQKTETVLAALREEFSGKLFKLYNNAVVQCVQSERSLLDLKKGVTPGVYVKNGLTLVIDENFGFCINGVATENTVFYLYSGHGNPCGAWQSVAERTAPGKYVFSTRTKYVHDRFYIQLVLTKEDRETKKWIPGNRSTHAALDCEYSYRLVRAVIEKGESVDIEGRLSFEAIK